jgi:hypothetical protein
MVEGHVNFAVGQKARKRAAALMRLWSRELCSKCKMTDLNRALKNREGDNYPKQEKNNVYTRRGSKRCCGLKDAAAVLTCPLSSLAFFRITFVLALPCESLLARAITAPSHARAGARRCLRFCRVRCQRKVACSGVKGAEARRCKAAAHTRGGTGDEGGTLVDDRMM